MKKKVKKILKCVLVFGISFVIAGAITGGMHSAAAGTYPAGAGTVAEIQSRGTLKYEIDGNTVHFCSSDLVNLRNELISLGQWTDTKFSDLDTKMTALQNACR